MKAPDARALKVSKPLLLLLALTLGLIVFVYFRGERDEAAPPAPPSTPDAATPASSASAPDTHAPENVAVAANAPVDLFPSQNWQPPPPPPPPPGSVKPPPPPEPPPLPFTVRSLWLDSRGVLYIVLAGTGREFPLCADCQKKGFLRRGDTILNAYRIDAIDRKQVRFTYLPLKRQQTLSLGEIK
ncbi:hypothetical protein NOV72_05908 [Caballeronia novacaledonica]|uniref:Uncharacterized protein n=1 Tax=Caballeronia novacaledonica TaxID=1544861 RepID=A0A2U3IER4_9BURK|nr:hypothetical protein [Caballeronia novacaledonica]SPB18706.1 hypothetical protein NOV72_05908 [Caballeronia novacaledonica]